MSIRRLSVGGSAVVLWVALLGVLALPALAAAPEVPSSVTVLSPLGATRVSVEGFLSPKAEGHPGTYEFLFNKASAGECESGGHAPEAPGMMLGLEDERVGETLSGLEPGTEYMVCLLARNAKEETTIGPATTFKTAIALETPETTTPATGVTGSEATLHGVLNPGAEAEAGERYQFVYRASSSECEGEQASSEESPKGVAKGEAVETKVTGLSPSTEYAFCLRAINAAGETATGNAVTFTTSAAPPTVEGESFSAVGPHGATLTAQVNPENLAGSYYYEYSTSPLGTGEPSKTSAVSYGQGTSSISATVELSGLEARTEYHFRLVVRNANDETGEGPELVFKTLPVATGLPDNRVFEMVTPPDNDGADVHIPVATTTSATIDGTPVLLPFQVALDGNEVTYIADPTVGGYGKGGNGLGNQYLAQRAAGGGWVQSNIQPAARAATSYQGFSSELNVGVLESGREPAPRLAPLSPEAPGEGYGVLYACTLSAGPCTAPEESVASSNPFRPLFTGPLNRTAEVESEGAFGTQGFGLRGLGVIDDGYPESEPAFAGSAGGDGGGGVLFEANDALLKGSGVLEQELKESVSREIINSEDGNYLYDSVGGRLGLVDVLPSGGVAGDATFGGTPFAGNEFDPPDFSNVVSEDGSRVYWTDLHTGVVYARVDGASTVQVSEGVQPARYWTSAADGRYAFYTEGKVEGEGEGLYRFDVASKAREVLVAPSGGVLGVVGTSEGGEVAYFVAEGALSGANAAGVAPTTGQPNLYLLRHGGAPVFIATLSPGDGSEMPPFHEARNTDRAEYGDWQPALANRTAEVSADGGGVVFMSSEALPVAGFPGGFATGGAVEVYMFDAAANQLFCVSCSSSGETPTVTASGAAAYLPISWTDTYLPRWMSSDGSRVFFDSVVPLTADDTDGRQDVYEWEREGTGTCTKEAAVNGGCVYLLSGGSSKSDSWLMGASASGNDAFIITRAQLAPEDQNGDLDVYDARVDGVQRVSAPACTGTGCQGVPAPPPTFATPPSVTYTGVGNFLSPAPVKAVAKPKSKGLTPAQKRAKALEACRKYRPGKRRRSCEAQVKKRYAAKLNTKKSAKGRK